MTLTNQLLKDSNQHTIEDVKNVEMVLRGLGLANGAPIGLGLDLAHNST